MSKNRNRAKFNKAHGNKEYNMLQKRWTVDCPICSKRAGSYTATCYPIRWNKKYKRGFKNSHKSITTSEAREFRTWKHNRKTKWKDY